MAKFQVVEENSCMILVSFSTLEDALNVLKNIQKAYYIYQQGDFSEVSFGVWRSGQMIASEKYW